MTTNRAAGYSPTDRAEERSVRTLEALLDDDRIKPLFNKNSTIPNTDGVLHVLENAQTWNPIAIFDVQIKTLGESDLSRKGYNVSRELLSYAKDVATNPTLLFGVNADKSIAFWVHLDKALAKSKLEEMTGDSITVRFPDTNEISGAVSKGYIDEWVKIHSKDIRAIQLFDEREIELEKTRAASAIINRTGTSISLPGDGRKLQEFSDALNDLYNREFLSIKNIFYPDAWKIGLGIFDSEENRLSYTLYPVALGSTDLPIKKLDQQIAHDLQGIDFVRSHFRANPIYESSKGYAYQCVSEDVKKALELDIYKFSNELLCREIIFGTIENDRNGILGLDGGKDQYSIDELKFSLETYLPCYLHVYLSFLVSAAPNFSSVIDIQLQTRGFVEIDDLLILKYHFTPDGLKQLEDAVTDALKEPQKHRILFPIHSKKLNLKRYSNAITALVKSADRPYSKPQNTGRGTWIWSDYTVEEVSQRVALVFGALPVCIEDIVKQNFPLLSTELDYFRDFDSLIVHVLESSGRGFGSGFTVDMYAVKSDDPALKRQVIVLSPDDADSFKDENHTNGTAVYKGKTVELVYSSRGGHSELFRSYPLSTNIIQFLHERLEQFFKKNGSKANWGPRNQYQYL